MTKASEFTPQWTKVIARSWVDPDFKSKLEANPEAVLTTYGITKVGGQDLSSMAGHIQVIDGASAGTDRPHMDGNQLVIPLPPAPKTYDSVVDPDSVAVAGAGTPTSILQQQEMMAQPAGQQVHSTLTTAGGQTKTTTMGQTSQSNNQSQSVPSVPSLDDDDDEDEDGEEAGADAGGDAGADAAEAGADVAVEGGADAAADAAAAAVALCA